MEIRKFLYSCRGAVYEIRSLERQREAVRLPIGPRSGSTSIVDMTSKDSDPTTTALNQMDYYDGVLLEARELLAKKLLELEGYLKILPESTDRTIMRYYFGQGWRHMMIADELGIDESTVKRRKNRAVQSLERKFYPANKCP